MRPIILALALILSSQAQASLKSDISACFAGDAEACARLDDLHREACKEDPDHDDCAMFNEE